MINKTNSVEKYKLQNHTPHDGVIIKYTNNMLV
jgi:hypothetical protein